MWLRPLTAPRSLSSVPLIPCVPDRTTPRPMCCASASSAALATSGSARSAITAASRISGPPRCWIGCLSVVKRAREPPRDAPPRRQDLFPRRYPEQLSGDQRRGAGPARHRDRLGRGGALRGGARLASCRLAGDPRQSPALAALLPAERGDG